MAYQVGQVQQQPILSPLEQDSRVAQADAQRLTLTAMAEKRRAEIQAQQQKAQRDTYLQEAYQRLGGDEDALVKEVKTRDLQWGNELEADILKRRGTILDARIKDANLTKSSMEADTAFLDRMVDDATFQAFRSRLSPELQQVVGDRFDPERIAQLKPHGQESKDRLNTLGELLGKGSIREALLVDLAEADTPEEWQATWQGYAGLGLKPTEIQAFQSMFGSEFSPEGLAAVRQKIGPQKASANQQSKEFLLDGRVVFGTFDPATGKYFHNGQDVTAKARPVPPREPQGPTSPVAVMGPDGKPIYVRPSDAYGKTPASAGGDSGSGGAKLSATAIEKVAGVDQSIGMLDDIDRLMPNMAGFIGPLDGRAAKARLATGAGVTSELAEFDAQLTGLKNAVIKATTGAAMSEPEAKRIMGQLPDLSLPEEVFKARLATTRKNLELLKKRTIELSGGTVAPASKEVPKKLSAAELIKKYGGG